MFASLAIRLHARAMREVQAASLTTLVLSALVISLVLFGASYAPLIDWHLAIISDPTAPFAGMGWRSYLLNSPLTYVLAHGLGVTTRFELAVMSLTIIAVGLGVLTYLAKRHHGQGARMVPIAFFISPIGAVLVTWLGHPDPVTMIAAGALVLARSRAALFACAAVLGFHHFEVGVLACTASYLLLMSEERNLLIPFGVGLALGHLGLVQWHEYCGQHPVTRAEFADHAGLWPYVVSVFGNAPALVFSLFGLAWPIVIDAVSTKLSRVAIACGSASVVVLGGSLLALDPTRIFALASWPIVLFVVTRRPNLNLGVWCVVAGLVIPRLIVQGGFVFGSGWHLMLTGYFR